jgi:hypothetical protein
MMAGSGPINLYAQTTLFELVILSNLIAFAALVNKTTPWTVHARLMLLE